MPPRLRRKCTLKHSEKGEDINDEKGKEPPNIGKRQSKRTSKRNQPMHVNVIKKHVESDNDADSEGDKIDKMKFSPLKLKCSSSKSNIENNKDEIFFNLFQKDALVVAEKLDKKGTKYTNIKKPDKIINKFLDSCGEKENVTPPDSQSTPALLKLKSRKLDTSLFGFENMDSPLPFSPVIGVAVNSTLSSPKTFSPAISSIKQKNKHKALPITYGFNDIPLKKAKKQNKRKKNVKEQNVNEDVVLNDLKSQFDEIEQHELIIE